MGDAPAYTTRAVTVVPHAAAMHARIRSPRLSDGYVPRGVARAADGSLRLTQSGGKFGRLQKIDEMSGLVMSSYMMPAGVEDIEFGPDGLSWAISEAGSQRWNPWPTFFPLIFSLDVPLLR